MTAYLLYLYFDVVDRAELEIYWRDSPATYREYRFSPLAVYTPFEVLEGEADIKGVVMAEFASIDEARKWFTSPAYTEARHHHEKGARYLGLLVQAGHIADVKQRLAPR